jgi:class 3 adenylate cyclase
VWRAVDWVRYRPPHLDLVMACAASQPGVPAPLARWVAETRARPAVMDARGWPHRAVRALAWWAARLFGPTGSAVVRWGSAAGAALADHLGANTIERPLRTRVHPGLLVPHPHTVAVLAVDMRGFSNLTQVLDDTQYLTNLLEEYLTDLTRVVERHRGVVFQYTGDGFLALFLPELSAVDGRTLLDGLVRDLGPALNQSFDELLARWRVQWLERGHPEIEVGLGVGLSFGQATIGFVGPSGKKHFGVVGAPANLAAFLCAQAEPGMMLVDRASFARAGATPPDAKVMRLLSKKLRRRVEALCVRYGAPRTPERSSLRFFSP